LNYNGGYVAPGHFRIPGRSYHEWAYETLVYLCPVWAAVETEGNSDSDLVAVLKAQEELRAGITMFGVDPDDELSQHWRAKPFCDLMQIGKGPPSGGLELVCLGGRGSALGRVYLVSPWPEPGDEEICEIAPTFASFLGMLTDYDPDHVKAIKTGDVATLRRWLDAGGDPNEVYRNMPLLSWGIFHAQPESVRELLLRGVKVYDGARNHATGCQQVMELLDHFSRK
jgi:hypothetical protein